MKKKVIALGVLLFIMLLLFISWDTIYLSLKESDWNDTSNYIMYVNEEREKLGKVAVLPEMLYAETTYTGNYTYLTKIYVEDQFEMIFLTRAFNNSMFDWSYHTIPFTPAEDIDESALENWTLR